MEGILIEVDKAEGLLRDHFASTPKVIVDRGPIMPSTDVDMPVHLGVSLRQVAPEDDVDGSPSPKRASISLYLQCAENDYSEKELYTDYFLPAIRVLEEEDWAFDGSQLAVSKEGTKVYLGIRGDMSRLVI